eukprot:gene9100-16756_t
MQGKDQLRIKMFQHVLAFESKLKLFLEQLSKKDTSHFELLTSRVNIFQVNFQKYTHCIKTLSAEFDSRFEDFRTNQDGFRLFADPFRVDINGYQSTFPLELLDMQNNFELKNAHSEVDLLRFSQMYQTNIKELARRCAKNKKKISKMKHIKTEYRAQLSDPSLKNQLRISLSSIRADINKLVDGKQCQIFH